jgi:hypothetical protein
MYHRKSDKSTLECVVRPPIGWGNPDVAWRKMHERRHFERYCTIQRNRYTNENVQITSRLGRGDIAAQIQ